MNWHLRYALPLAVFTVLVYSLFSDIASTQRRDPASVPRADIQAQQEQAPMAALAKQATLFVTHGGGESRSQWQGIRGRFADAPSRHSVPLPARRRPDAHSRPTARHCKVPQVRCQATAAEVRSFARVDAAEARGRHMPDPSSCPPSTLSSSEGPSV